MMSYEYTFWNSFPFQFLSARIHFQGRVTANFSSSSLEKRGETALEKPAAFKQLSWNGMDSIMYEWHTATYYMYVLWFISLNDHSKSFNAIHAVFTCPEHTQHTHICVCVCKQYVYYVIFEYLGSDTDQRNFSYLQMQLGRSLTMTPGLTSCSPARFSVSWPFFFSFCGSTY